MGRWQRTARRLGPRLMATSPHFKIVQLVNKKGTLELAAVPAKWEQKGILKWPTSHMSRNALKKVLQDASSVPGNGREWTDYKCTVKRTNILTFEDASKEIDVMQGNSDTDVDSNKMLAPITSCIASSNDKRSARRRVITTVANKNADASRNDFNDDLSILSGAPPPTSSLQPKSGTFTSVSFPTYQQQQEQQNYLRSPTVVGDNTTVYAPHQTSSSALYQTHQSNSFNMLPTTPHQRQSTSEIMNVAPSTLHPTHLSQEEILLTNCEYDFSTIVGMFQSIGEQIGDLHKKIDLLLDAQLKNKVASSVKEATVAEEIFQPVESIDALTAFNEKLQLEPEYFAKLLQYFASLCDKKSVSQSNNPVVTLGFFYADKIWTRELMTKYSWAGGSKDREVSKGAFKSLMHVQKLFHNLLQVHVPNCTLLETNKFIKSKIIQHSVRRANNLGLRESAPKIRATPTIRKTKKTAMRKKKLPMDNIDETDVDGNDLSENVEVAEFEVNGNELVLSGDSEQKLPAVSLHESTQEYINSYQSPTECAIRRMINASSITETPQENITINSHLATSSAALSKKITNELTSETDAAVKVIVDWNDLYNEEVIVTQEKKDDDTSAYSNETAEERQDDDTDDSEEWTKEESEITFKEITAILAGKEKLVKAQRLRKRAATDVLNESDITASEDNDQEQPNAKRHKVPMRRKKYVFEI